MQMGIRETGLCPTSKEHSRHPQELCMLSDAAFATQISVCFSVIFKTDLRALRWLTRINMRCLDQDWAEPAKLQELSPLPGPQFTFQFLMDGDHWNRTSSSGPHPAGSCQISVRSQEGTTPTTSLKFCGSGKWAPHPKPGECPWVAPPLLMLQPGIFKLAPTRLIFWLDTRTVPRALALYNITNCCALQSHGLTL